MSMRARLLVWPVVLLAVASIGSAQTHPAAARFAVEISAQGASRLARVTLYGGTASWTSSTALFRPDRNAPLEAGQPRIFRVDCRAEGELVRFTANFIFFDIYVRSMDPAEFLTAPGQRVFEYSATLGESVTLSEMREFALRPLTLKLVEASRGRRFPRATSKAPSVLAEVIGEDRGAFIVALRNLSGKGVVGYSLSSGNPVRADGGAPVGLILIPPGATYQGFINAHANGVRLEAVVFDDGSCEGNPRVAAEVATFRIGAEVQQRRFDDLVQAALADARLDDNARIARIRAETGELPETPDAELIEIVHKRVSWLRSREVPGMHDILTRALTGQKQMGFVWLAIFEKHRADYVTLAHFWSLWRHPKTARGLQGSGTLRRRDTPRK
jgi:hypothetical protein